MLAKLKGKHAPKDAAKDAATTAEKLKAYVSVNLSIRSKKIVCKKKNKKKQDSTSVRLSASHNKRRVIRVPDSKIVEINLFEMFFFRRSKKRAKYADLLSAIQTNDDENQYKEEVGDMEITFSADLDAEKKLQEMVQRKVDGKETTVFDQLMDKERKRRQEKKQAAKLKRRG